MCQTTKSQSYNKKTAMKLITVILLIFCLSNCTDIQVSHEQDTAPEFEKNAKVAVILNRGAIITVDDPEELEEKIADCVRDELAKIHPPIEVVSPERFRQSVFPGMNYDLIPSSPESIFLLLDKPDFGHKLESLGIRYLVLVEPDQKSASEKWGGCGGGAGPPGFACLVFWIWDNETNLESTIMDAKRKIKLGNVTVNAVAHPFFGIFIIIPVGWPAFSEGPSCSAFGKEIANFFQNYQPTTKQQENLYDD